MLMEPVNVRLDGWETTVQMTKMNAITPLSSHVQTFLRAVTQMDPTSVSVRQAIYGQDKAVAVRHFVFLFCH